MPKYRFNWTNLPPAVLRALRRDLTVGYDDEADPADALREAYGARPDEEFIREAWPTLLRSWLPTATQPRERIVQALQEAHHDKALVKGRGAQLAYLRDLRNAKRLRGIVWEEFVAAGQVEQSSNLDAKGDADTSKKEEEIHDRQPEEQAGKVNDSELTLADLERRLWDAANLDYSRNAANEGV